MRLEAESFLTELRRLFEKNTESGTVYVTMKRTAERPKRSKKLPPVVESECRCLVRASDGRRKISTVLGEGELASFRTSYSSLLRASASALKKRDRGRGKRSAPKE